MATPSTCPPGAQGCSGQCLGDRHLSGPASLPSPCARPPLSGSASRTCSREQEEEGLSLQGTEKGIGHQEHLLPLTCPHIPGFLEGTCCAGTHRLQWLLATTSIPCKLTTSSPLILSHTSPWPPTHSGEGAGPKSFPIILGAPHGEDCGSHITVSSPRTEAETPLVFRPGFCDWRPLSLSSLGHPHSKALPPPPDWGLCQGKIYSPSQTGGSPRQGVQTFGMLSKLLEP